jgi:acyl dehydratase
MFFEDVVIGTQTQTGSWTFTEEEIISFAKKYDPQSFHIDPEAAKSHEFGGIVASGFHIGSIWMKLTVANMQKAQADLKASGETPPEGSGGRSAGVSPGFKKMRWHGPVRPGDTITYSNTVAGKVPMGSRTDIAIIQTKTRGVNQRGELVFSFIGQGIYPKRPSS